MGLPPVCDETWFLCEEKEVAVVCDLARSRVLSGSSGPGAARAALRAACSAPTEGKPRRPRHLQVEREDHLETLRGVMPGVKLVLAPRPPEVERALASLVAMADGREAQSALKAFTWAGVRLMEAEPWKVFDDEGIIVSAPEHGLERGALVVIGQNDSQYGFLLFSSPEDLATYEAFAHNSLGADLDTQPVDFLCFDLPRANEVDPSHRRAVEAMIGKRKRLPVAASVKRGVDLQIADERETRLLTAVAECLTRLCIEEAPHVSHVFVHGGVTLEVPDWMLEKDPVFGVDYFDVDEGAPHRVDELRLLGRIAQWCSDNLANAYEAELCETFYRRLSSPKAAALGMWPRLLLTDVEGKTFVDHYRAANSLTADEEGILAAQAAAWTGIWNTGEDTPAGLVPLVEQLTGERREVTRTPLFDSLPPGSFLCGRVITLDGADLLIASDPMALKPGLPPDGLLKTVRAELDWSPDGPVTLDAARMLEAQLTVLELWDDLMDHLAGHLPPASLT